MEIEFYNLPNKKCSDTIDVKQFVYKNSNSSSIIESKQKITRKDMNHFEYHTRKQKKARVICPNTVDLIYRRFLFYEYKQKEI